MYSKTATGKASKGSVAIVSSHGRLQLRFRFAGKRHYISLGFADTPQNRKLAEMRAREIELNKMYKLFQDSFVYTRFWLFLVFLDGIWADFGFQK